MTKILDLVNGKYLNFTDSIVEYEKSPSNFYFGGIEQYLYFICKVDKSSKYYNRNPEEFEVIYD